ncbi:hypothetical protein [Streptomyces cupreus]|uniref:Uncharacterized protein n=1 Tax=Streptomyces cupreus TaxID=2759956 RepID=A0A7X1MB13_9ACTN|nr:hypothetical protein [Streptomyces cupreus]MBC2904283.1 hypothetical protein [Streptomyces cupreus]
MAWWAHMEPMLTTAPFAPQSIMLAATVWVRKKEAVDGLVAVVVLGGVLQEGLRGEDTGHVDQEGGVGVLLGEMDGQTVHGRGIGQVRSALIAAVLQPPHFLPLARLWLAPRGAVSLRVDADIFEAIEDASK